VLLGIGAYPPVDLLSQADLIDYAGDDPRVVDVLNFNLRLLSMYVNAPKNTSAREVNVRNVGGLRFILFFYEAQGKRRTPAQAKERCDRLKITLTSGAKAPRPSTGPKSNSTHCVFVLCRS
jgi:hypothetical protein